MPGPGPHESRVSHTGVHRHGDRFHVPSRTGTVTVTLATLNHRHGDSDSDGRLSLSSERWFRGQKVPPNAAKPLAARRDTPRAGTWGGTWKGGRAQGKKEHKKALLGAKSRAARDRTPLR
eukprot:2108379-Rhodomonas_salina.2